MHFSSDGGTISYTDVGHGPPIVFLHALGRSASDWSAVVAGLSAEFRCIAIDFPGHGESVWTGRYEFRHMVGAVRDLIAVLDLGSFSVAAHSMGATVAWMLVPDLADRVEALVIEDTAAPTDRHRYPSVPAVPPEPVGYDWEARRQIFANLNSPDPRWRERIADLDVRTLLIAGTADDEEVDETAAILNDARIVIIPVGHWIHEAATDEFVTSVRSFLTLD